MAWGPKYQCEFTDINGVDWSVYISEDGYEGAIIPMIPAGNPLTIEWLTPGDDLTIGAIKGSMAILNVECTTNFEYIGLYGSGDLIYPVNIYKNDILYWTGWLSNEYTEPYDNVPYTVSITAADGIGLLKQIEYKNGTLDYTGRVTESEIILTILGKIGHTQFTEFCNLYEDRMDDDVDDSPFNQAYIDNDLFIDADCYSVIDAILTKYNAVIRQKAGQFIIYRPVELLEDTVYGRIITSATTIGTSLSADKVLDRAGLDLIDVEGGVLMLKPPMSKLTAEQDYGYKKSWLKNHTFKTWDISSEFKSWTRVGSFGIIPAKEGGITFITPPGSSGPNDAHYIYQDFGTHAKASTTDVLRLKFDYVIDNQTRVPADVTIKLAVYDDTRVHILSMLDDTELFQWDNGSYNRIHWTVADVPPGINSYTFDQSVIGIPCDGGFRIYLFYTVAGTYLTIKNLCFQITSDQLNKVNEVVKKWIIPGIIRYTYKRELPVEVVDREEVVGRKYEVPNGTYGEAGKLSYVLGDCEDTGMMNVLEQFNGSLAIQETGSLAETAIDFVNSHAAAYAAGGVAVTASGSNILFESTAAGVNFTGSTTITNVSGTLTGTASTLQANVAQVNAQHTIQLAGTSGTATISVGGVDATATYSVSLATTASNFVTNNASSYAVAGITVTADSDILTFEADSGVFDPAYTSTITTDTVDLTGDVDVKAQPYTAAVKRRDQVALSGTSGTANILCDGVTRLATYNTDTVLTHTASWHTRGNTEGLPLAKLIGNEVAAMYNTGRHFIQLNLYELTESLDVIKNLQDPLNLVGASRRVFVFSRGTLNCQAREWTADLIEIGTK